MASQSMLDKVRKAGKELKIQQGKNNECPHGEADWIKRKTNIKIHDGKNFQHHTDQTENHHVEAHSDTTSSSESENEKEHNRKNLASTKTDRYHFNSDFKKRTNKVSSEYDLPDDVHIIVDDMDDHLKPYIFQFCHEAKEKFSDDEEHGPQRAKYIKMRLDAEFDPQWHVCIIPDKYWAACSFQPGYTFAFERHDVVYMMWRTPHPRARS